MIKSTVFERLWRAHTHKHTHTLQPPAALCHFHILSFQNMEIGSEAVVGEEILKRMLVWLGMKMPSDGRKSPAQHHSPGWVSHPVTFKGWLRLSNPALASDCAIRWPETTGQTLCVCVSEVRSGEAALAAAHHRSRWAGWGRLLGSLQTWVGSFRTASRWELNLSRVDPTERYAAANWRLWANPINKEFKHEDKRQKEEVDRRT